MARRARGRFVRPAPRTKVWIGILPVETTLTAGASTLVGVLNAAALLLRPFTILRTHILVSYMSDQDTASERPFGAYGVQVVTENASGVGITALPTPAVDTDSDWFIWQALRTITVGLTSVGVDIGGDRQYNIDSKAMRKVGANDDVVIVVDEVSAVGSRIMDAGRMLVQLH